MSDQLRTQVQDMFKSIYDAVDIKYVRPIKRQMFDCLRECLDDTKSVQESEKCSDGCSRTLQKAMNIVQTEVNSFQGRIDRCLMDCQDGVRHEKDEDKARRDFDNCAAKCVNKFVGTVPDVIKSMCQDLDKIKKEASIR